MDLIVVLALWATVIILSGMSLSTARRVERKVEDLAKKQEKQEMYERMKNQQYQQSQQYQQYGNMNGYDQNNRL